MIDRILVVGIIIISAVILSYSDFGVQGKVYDCTLAEISSDYPIEVKNECRRLLKEYNDKENRLHT